MVKLHLDLPALERLIGGDTEIEIAVREGIVQSFAKRHLKAVVNTGVLEPYLKRIEAAVLTELEKAIPLKVRRISERWSTRDVYELAEDSELANRLEEVIQQRAQELTQGIIDEVFRGAWDELRDACIARIDKNSERMTKLVGEEVEKRVTTRFENEVHAEVNRRIAALAKAQ